MLQPILIIRRLVLLFLIFSKLDSSFSKNIKDFELPKFYRDSLTHTDNDPEFKAHFCTAIGGIPIHELDDYRIDKRTNDCHSILEGEVGPCGSNMLFYPQANNSVYGNCDCKEKSRLLIFHEESNQCYPIFSKGYCQTGKWLTLSRSSRKPICEPNPCQHLLSEDDDVVLLDGHYCVKLGEESPQCNGDIIFKYRKIFPTCQQNERSTTKMPKNQPTTTPPNDGSDPTTSDYETFTEVEAEGQLPEGPSLFKPVNQFKSCPIASFRSLSGNCQPNWEW